ncbi:MAG: hypothetical protein KAJ73_10105, partial [Zetaproteobacteria bacterium]|nr:hypothetical protein [Zetaproteobacteria bacterium]
MRNKPELKAMAVLFAIVMVTAGTATGEASANDSEMPYPVNMDAIEEIYPLDAAAKEKLFENGFVVLKDHEHGNISD